MGFITDKLRGSEYKDAEAALLGVAREAGDLIAAIEGLRQCGGLEGEHPPVEWEEGGPMFSFRSVGIRKKPGDEVDLILTSCGVCYTADGEVVGWPSDFSGIDPNSEALPVLRKTDYKPQLSAFIGKFPGKAARIPDQIRRYSELLYSAVKAGA